MRWIGVLVLAALWGCAGERGVIIAESPTWGEELEPAFRDAPPRLLGFDEVRKPTGIGAGDRAVMGLRLERDGKVQVRYIELEASSPLKHADGIALTLGQGEEERMYVSEVVIVHTKLLDESGVLLKQGDGRTAAGFVAAGLLDFTKLMHGQFRAKEAGLEPPPISKMPKEQRETVDRGLCGLLAFSGSVNRNANSIFRGMALEFLGFRGVMDAVLSLGSFSLEISPQTSAGAVRLPGVEGELEAYNLPLIVKVGRKEALTCVLTVVKPGSPLALTCGVVRAEIVRTGEPTNRITMQLLSARRGRAVGMLAAE